MKKNQSLVMPVVLMLAFSLTRWPGFFPDDWKNFSAAYALAFCAGVYLPGALAWILPLASLFLTDVLLNAFYYRVPTLNVYMLMNYPVFAVLIWLGRQHSRKSSWGRLVMGGLLGAVLFYLVTNTLSWLQNPQYPKTFAGWLQALSTGIPGFPPTWMFFRNTLLSGGLFTGLFAAAMKLTEPAEQEEEQEVPEEKGEAEPADQPQEGKA